MISTTNFNELGRSNGAVLCALIAFHLRTIDISMPVTPVSLPTRATALRIVWLSWTHAVSGPGTDPKHSRCTYRKPANDKRPRFSGERILAKGLLAHESQSTTLRRPRSSHPLRRPRRRRRSRGHQIDDDRPLLSYGVLRWRWELRGGSASTPVNGWRILLLLTYATVINLNKKSN